MPCCILLDNCPAHKLSNQEYADLEQRNVYVKFLPPNFTSKRQPADMGMIASLKVGYKTLMLNHLLDIFDEQGGYELAAERRKRQRPGCKGLAYGGKATVLDAMKIIHSMWDVDGKYARVDGIKRCWRKADILPASWNADLNNEVGSLSMRESDKKISDEECKTLCNLMKQIQIKAQNTYLDTSSYGAGRGFENSFVTDPDAYTLSAANWNDMATNWIDIEDDEDIMNEEIDEVLENLERAEQEQVDENDDDKDEEDDEETEDDEPVKVRKTEALKAIDLLKRYCREQEMGPDLHGQIQRVENQMMNHRFEKSTAQRSLISYFGTSS